MTVVQQFAKFVERLQIYISSVLDEEFKKFLFSSNINIDPNLFELKLPKPSNYEKYKQADIDSALLGTIGSADSIAWLSKRWIGKRYLQMSEDELLENEKLIKQERGLPEDTKNLKDIYGPQVEPGMEGDMGGMGGMGGGLGGIGGDLGGGGMASASDLSLGGPSEPGAAAPPSGAPTAATPAPSL
jgi:hypothetical protein